MAGVSTISSISTSTNGTWTPVTCTIFPDNPTHCDIVVTVRRVVASLSLIGCLFMIGIIWLYRKYIVFSQRLILYLSIAAFMDCIAYLMGDIHPDGPVCDFQAFWLTYFDWAVLLWVSCVTFNLYMNVVRMRLTERFEWLYHLLCWLFPLVMSCLPFIGDHYGPAGAWCWIKEEWEWRAGIWYGPLFSIIIIMVITYVYIIWRIKKRAQRWEGTYDPDVEQHKQLMKDDIKVLRAYPFIYLAVSIFPLINRIQNAVAHEKHAFVLVLLASISAPLHGALNAVVFGMDQDTMSRLTPSQIKAAFRSRLSPQAVIKEYPSLPDNEAANDEQ